MRLSELIWHVLTDGMFSEALPRLVRIVCFAVQTAVTVLAIAAMALYAWIVGVQETGKWIAALLLIALLAWYLLHNIRQFVHSFRHDR